MEHSKRPISLGQVIDLLRATPEVAARMGQYDQLETRLPELFVEMETIAAKLDALGINGWGILRRSPRLRHVFKYYDYWKDIQTHGQPTAGRALVFTIAVSDLTENSGAITLLMRQTSRRRDRISLELEDGELRAVHRHLACRLPVRHKANGSLSVTRDFFRMLRLARGKDGEIQCRLTEDTYVIDGATFRPSPAAQAK